MLGPLSDLTIGMKFHEVEAKEDWRREPSFSHRYADLVLYQISGELTVTKSVAFTGASLPYHSAFTAA